MALTDDFALYALGVAAQESHPMLIESRCLNHVQFKMTCDCCTDACPAGIELHGARIDWGACTNCNLCVTACPTGALAESASLARTLTAAIPVREDGEGNAAANSPEADTAQVVTIACTRHSGPADIKLSCVASLSWEFAAMFALNGILVLKTSACRECPDAECRTRVHDLISELRRFLGPDEFTKRVMPKAPARNDGNAATSAKTGAEAARKRAGSARRAALESATDMAKSAAVRLSEEGGDGRAARLADRRGALLETIAAAPAHNKPLLHWQSLTVDDDCRGCTVCERMCPNHAITIRLAGGNRQGDAQEKASSAEGGIQDAADQAAAEPANAFIHDASRCTQCGLCYMSCPEQAISDWETFTCDAVPALRTTPIHVAFCEKCGKPFKPKDGSVRCPACSRFRFA